MKVLAATRRTQGAQADDFDHTIDGELVYINTVCEEACLDLDDCGCRRAFIGMVSAKATTTAEVRELDVSLDDFRAMLLDSLESAGWRGVSPERLTTMTYNLTATIGHLPAGAVVGRSFDRIEVR